jgi:membrane protease YdiL (CAAX protease family)
MTMSTMFADSAYLPPPLPPPPPPIVAPAPRPLGIWRALGWFGLAVLAAFAAAFLYGLGLGIWSLTMHPGRPIVAPDGHGLSSAILLAAMLAAFFATLLLACRCSGWRAADYLALVRPRGPWLRLGAAAFLVPLAVNLAAAFASATPGPPPKAGIDLALLLLGITVIAPIGEELVFRGFLFRALAETRLGAASAIVLTALVWAGLHFDKSWLGMAAMLFTGLVWGWLRWCTQSTLATIAVHALNNLVAGTGLVVAVLAAS